MEFAYCFLLLTLFAQCLAAAHAVEKKGHKTKDGDGSFDSGELQGIGDTYYPGFDSGELLGIGEAYYPGFDSGELEGVDSDYYPSDDDDERRTVVAKRIASEKQDWKKEEILPDKRSENERVYSKRVFDCKELNEACKGLVKCCGSLQCYWPDGYSAFTSGHCVRCVNANEKCQRDAQCCHGMACHKGNRYHIDGRCGSKRYTGQECHDDDQCISGDCNLSFGQKIKGSGGSCS